jgi:uncharacterized protein Yka (UPF0111/DUF47 family)
LLWVPAMKSKIIEQLGQSDILLPSRIAEGLLANDRVKVRLSILQAALHHARDPSQAHFDLANECRTLGIDPVAMETLVNRASEAEDKQIAAPGLGTLRAAIWQDVATMADAVKSGDAAEGELVCVRLSALKGPEMCEAPDIAEAAEIAKLTELSDGDSVHRLVMDLHKALNRLATAHAEEVVSGAHVYGLLSEDRPSIEAFMHGVNSTRKLKFDHPGLSTTAGRCGNRLMIQNDIGETDAHVVVIAVERDAVQVTYTDVHLARAKFFTGLFRNFSVHWSGLDRKTAEGLGDDGVFYLVTGRYPIDGGNRDAFLEAVGASLVFLIDWNKARKVLRGWVSTGDAVHVLDWAARHRFGHRAFLELGGSELVGAAVRHATPNRIGFGERLERALGRDAAVDFLKTVLRVSTEALLEGRSVRLVRDQIEADLVRHLERVDSALLATVTRQAGLAREIACEIGRYLAAYRAGRPTDGSSLAMHARRIEEKADRIAIEARNEIARLEAKSVIEQLVNRAEEAIDELEQAAFIASIMPADLPADVFKPLADLCSAAVSAAEAAGSGLDAAAEVPEGKRADAEDALAAVSRLIDSEHLGDAAEREVTKLVLRGGLALPVSLSVLELARAIERATDRLAGFGHLLREHVLAELST